MGIAWRLGALAVLCVSVCCSQSTIPHLNQLGCPVDPTSGVVGIGCPCSIENGTFASYNFSVLEPKTNNLTVINITKAFISDSSAVVDRCVHGGACGICAAGAACVGNWTENESTGTCLPCTLSQLCEQGTVNHLNDEEANTCSAGYFCVSPSEYEICPRGYFCPQGTIQPVLCNQTDPEGNIVIPLQAVYCEEGSPHPLFPCPCGYYCPNPSERIVCPKGHYCPIMSLSPIRCWVLANCHEGTCSPAPSVLGWILAVIIFLLFIGLSFVFNIWWRAVQEQRASVAVLEQKIGSLRTSLLRMAGGSACLQDTDMVKGFDKKTVRLTVSFKNLGLKLKNGKMVLSGVTGVFPHSNLIAVMGPSGSGKSTMLNVLCGKARYGTMTGELRVNEKVAQISDLRSVTGFVPQDDVVHTELTVLENLLFSARLRLGPKVGRAKQEQIVSNTINLLQLTHVQNTVVGTPARRGISGGQRKRVNVGLELVADPTLLFLDEPTSGLDSTSSEEILGCLKSMATLGMTVVAVIHQPRVSIFNMFDQVLLLGKGGLTTYIGPSIVAKDYFSMIGFECPPNVIPPDHFLDVLSNRRENSKDPAIRAEQLPEIWQTHVANNTVPKADVDEQRRERALQKMKQRNFLLQMVRDVFSAVHPHSTGDDGLDYEELSLVFDNLGVKMSETEQAQALQEFDPTQSGKVNAVQFVNVLQRHLENDSKPKGPSNKDKEKDKDKDKDTDSSKDKEPTTPRQGFRALNISGSRKALPTLLGAMTGEVSDVLRSHDAPTTTTPRLDDVSPSAVRSDPAISSVQGNPNRLAAQSFTMRQQPALRAKQSVYFAQAAHAKAFMNSKAESNERELLPVTKGKKDLPSKPEWTIPEDAMMSQEMAADQTAYGRERKSFWRQFLVCLHRRLIKWWRSRTKRIGDLILTIVCAYILGQLQGSNWSITRIVPNVMQAHLALSVLTCSAALYPFHDHVIYWREAAAGINKPAFFLATALLDLADVVARPTVFTVVYLSITSARVGVFTFMMVSWFIAWVWSGIGYVLNFTLLSNASVAAVLLPLIFGGVLAGVEPSLASAEGNVVLQVLFSISPNRWSIEAITVSLLDNLPAHMTRFVDLLLDHVGYSAGVSTRDTMVLLCMGAGYRILAYIAMVRCNKDKQV